jgi:hypothetical protein
VRRQRIEDLGERLSFGDALERRLIGDIDARLFAHELGDRSRLDRIVHGDSALVRHGVLEVELLHRLEDVAMMGGFVRRRGGSGHWLCFPLLCVSRALLLEAEFA